MNKTAIKTVVDGFNQCVNGNGIAKKKKKNLCVALWVVYWKEYGFLTTGKEKH